MTKLRTTPEGEEWAYTLWNIIENRTGSHGRLVDPDEPIDMFQDEGPRGRATEKQYRTQFKILTAVRKLAPVDLIDLLVYLRSNEKMSQNDAYMGLDDLLNKKNGGPYVEIVTAEDPMGGVEQERLAEQSRREQSEVWNSPLFCPDCKKIHGPYHEHFKEQGRAQEVLDWVKGYNIRRKEKEQLEREEELLEYQRQLKAKQILRDIDI